MKHKAMWSALALSIALGACQQVTSAPATASVPDESSPTPVYLIAKSGGYRVDTFADGTITCYVMFKPGYNGWGEAPATAISCVKETTP